MISDNILAATLQAFQLIHSDDSDYEIVKMYRENRDDVIAIITELQQHREEKYERRWRKISELHDFPEYEYFQLQTADGEINKNPFWIDDRSILQTFEEEDSGIGDVSIEMACQWYTGFRPLLKD